MTTRLAKELSALVASLPLLWAIAAAPATAQEPECGDRAAIRVSVLDEPGTLLLPGATVVVRWPNSSTSPARRVTDGGGRVLLCVPRDAEEAVLWAEFGDDSSGQAELAALLPGDAREVRLRVLESARGGRLVGRVLDRETRRSVATAAVSLRGRPTVAETDRQGLFRLVGVPAGGHEIEVRRLGYAPLRHEIEVPGGLTTEVEIRLVRNPVELEPLVATATRSRRLEIKGFYERKHWGELTGNGHFFDTDYIERWRPSSIRTLLVSSVPGISWSLRNRRVNSGFSRLSCKMPFYVDGFLNGAMPRSMTDVAAVEVYKGAATLPAEFAGSDARCGAIVVWTK